MQFYFALIHPSHLAYIRDMPTEDVSVLMPNFNHARYLPRSVNAILAQTVRPRELIIIDDASTDDSVEVLEEFVRRDPLIHLIRNEKNLGIEENVNRGLKMIQGEYLTFAAADDQLLPTMIERSMAILRKHPQAGMSCGYHSVLIESIGEVRAEATSWSSEPNYLAPAQLAEVLQGGCVSSTSAIYRKESLLRQGGYHSELRWHADWFLNLMIGFREGICHVPDTLALMTVRDGSYCAAGKRDPKAQRTVLGAMLRRLLTPEYRDVLPMFQDSGVMVGYGEDLVWAAAELPERWTPALLGLIGGMDIEVYASLIDTNDPEVRELARFLAGPMWKRRLRERNELLHESARLHRLQASPVGRLWRAMGGLKRAFRRIAG
jgi:glycosyltransferase involved in cell wall biosynthesis